MSGNRVYAPVTHVTHSPIIDVSRTRARTTPYIGKPVTCVTPVTERTGGTGVLSSALDPTTQASGTLVPLTSHAPTTHRGSTHRSGELGYPISRNPGTTQTQSIVTSRSVSLYGLNLLLGQKAAGDLRQ